ELQRLGREESVGDVGRDAEGGDHPTGAFVILDRRIAEIEVARRPAGLTDDRKIGPEERAAGEDPLYQRSEVLGERPGNIVDGLTQEAKGIDLPDGLIRAVEDESAGYSPKEE